MSDAPKDSFSPDRRNPPAGRRAADAARQAADGGTNLPAVIAPKASQRRRASDATKSAEAAGAFDAQVLGQTGQKRGLRGGQPVLDQAKSAYLGTEYSGRSDRRPRSGLFTKTEI